MKADANIDQHAPVMADHLQFVRGDQPVRLQRLPVVAQIGRSCQPQHCLKIAQTAGTFLDVRFKIQGDVVVTRVAAFLLVDFSGEKSADLTRFFERTLEFFHQQKVTPDAAHFQQSRIDGDIFRRLFNAFRQRPHRDARLQADIPKQADKNFHARIRHHAIWQ